MNAEIFQLYYKFFLYMILLHAAIMQLYFGSGKFLILSDYKIFKCFKYTVKRFFFRI